MTKLRTMRDIVNWIEDFETKIDSNDWDKFLDTPILRGNGIPSIYLTGICGNYLPSGYQGVIEDFSKGNE